MSSTPYLFALRPWLAEDTVLVVIAIFLLVALVVMTSGRSFVAIGGLLGLLAGSVFAATTLAFAYGDKAMYVLGGCLLGFVVGGMVRLLWSTQKTNSRRPQPQRTAAFWAIAFGIAGTSLGLTAGVFLTRSFAGVLGIMQLGSILGILTGMACSVTMTEKVAELFLVLALSAGAGAILGWKVIWSDFVEPGSRLIDDDEQLQSLLVTTFIAAAGGACLGMVVWIAALLKSRVSPPSPILPEQSAR
jgi:hypothetical protein